MTSSAFDTKTNPEGVFDLIQPLGKGAFGTVYKAMDKRDGELVALKIMSEMADNGSLEEEVKIMKKCKSPYIVNFRDAFLYEKRIWLAMEYCGGGALLDIMKVRGRCLTEKQIQVVMRETLKGIYYLHSKNIIHRDIKAGNILVNAKGMCKLADFGVSKKESTFDKATTTIGSPYWMAPEVFTCDKYTHAVDIWSLGCTCIELAVGKPPFSDLHPLKAILQIPKSEPPRLPEGLPKAFSPGFKDFIASCCVKDASARPTAAHLFRNPWVRASRGLRILQSLVNKAQPYLDAWRKQMRDEDVSDDGEEEETEDEDSDDGDYDCSTTVFKTTDAGDSEASVDEKDDEAEVVQSEYKKSETVVFSGSRLDSAAMESFGSCATAAASLPLEDFSAAQMDLKRQFDSDRDKLDKWYVDARGRMAVRLKAMSDD